jgi:hypothetical protein
LPPSPSHHLIDRGGPKLEQRYSIEYPLFLAKKIYVCIYILCIYIEIL